MQHSITLDERQIAHLRKMLEAAIKNDEHYVRQIGDPTVRRQGLMRTRGARARADVELLRAMVDQVPGWAGDTPEWFDDGIAIDDHGKTWVRDAASGTWSVTGEPGSQTDVEMLDGDAASGLDRHPVVTTLLGGSATRAAKVAKVATDTDEDGDDADDEEAEREERDAAADDEDEDTGDEPADDVAEAVEASGAPEETLPVADGATGTEEVVEQEVETSQELDPATAPEADTTGEVEPASEVTADVEATAEVEPEPETEVAVEEQATADELDGTADEVTEQPAAAEAAPVVEQVSYMDALSNYFSKNKDTLDKFADASPDAV